MVLAANAWPQNQNRPSRLVQLTLKDTKMVPKISVIQSEQNDGPCTKIGQSAFSQFTFKGEKHPKMYFQHLIKNYRIAGF